MPDGIARHPPQSGNPASRSTLTPTFWTGCKKSPLAARSQRPAALLPWKQPDPRGRFRGLRGRRAGGRRRGRFLKWTAINNNAPVFHPFQPASGLDHPGVTKPSGGVARAIAFVRGMSGKAVVLAVGVFVLQAVMPEGRRPSDLIGSFHGATESAEIKAKQKAAAEYERTHGRRESGPARQLADGGRSLPPAAGGDCEVA